MSLSTFDVLIVPVLWGTFGAYVAGAAILTLMKLANALVGRVDRKAQAFQTAPRAARNRFPRGRRAAHGVGSIG